MTDSFVIKRPLVTEKSTTLTANGQYVFMVKTGATKPEIKKAIHSIYKVDVVAVNVINRPAKRKRFGGRRMAARDSYRKAVVTLKKGQTIDIQ